MCLVFALKEQQGEPGKMNTFLQAVLGKSAIAGLLLISEYSESFTHILKRKSNQLKNFFMSGFYCSNRQAHAFVILFNF